MNTTASDTRLPVPPPRTTQTATTAVTPAPEAGKAAVDGPDLTGIPSFLDRTKGMPKEQIDAATEKARKNESKPAKSSRTTKFGSNPVKASNLTEADKKAISELKKAGADKVSVVKQVGAKTKSEKAAKANGKASAPKKKTAKGTKSAIVGDLLRRKNGCTSAECLKATGWPSISMPAAAKAAGLKLRKEKEKGKPTQYFGS